MSSLSPVFSGSVELLCSLMLSLRPVTVDARYIFSCGVGWRTLQPWASHKPSFCHQKQKKWRVGGGDSPPCAYLDLTHSVRDLCTTPRTERAAPSIAEAVLESINSQTCAAAQGAFGDGLPDRRRTVRSSAGQSRGSVINFKVIHGCPRPTVPAGRTVIAANPSAPYDLRYFL